MMDSIVPADAEFINLDDDKPKPRLVEKYTKITKSKCELTELKKNVNFNKEPHDLFVMNVTQAVEQNFIDMTSLDKAELLLSPKFDLFVKNEPRKLLTDSLKRIQLLPAEERKTLL